MENRSLISTLVRCQQTGGWLPGTGERELGGLNQCWPGGSSVVSWTGIKEGLRKSRVSQTFLFRQVPRGKIARPPADRAHAIWTWCPSFKEVVKERERGMAGPLVPWAGGTSPMPVTEPGLPLWLWSGHLALAAPGHLSLP